jgi:hypothetical protein
MDIPWIFVGLAVGALAVTAGIALMFVTVKRRRGIEPDYRSLYMMGLIWAPIGLVLWLTLDNPGMIGLSVMGMIFLVIGLANREKWQAGQSWADMQPEGKRLRLILVGVGLIGLVLLVAMFLVIRTL